MDPIEIAREALGKDCLLIGAPQRIAGGLTNENWLIQTAGKSVVVRIGNANNRDLQINRHSEHAVLVAMNRVGIGAPVLLCDPRRHLLVTEYLAGRIWGPREVRKLENIARIANLLRRLHALPPPAGVQTIDLRTIVSGYWNTLMARGLSALAGSLEDRERARATIAELSAEATSCLCHNDIHHLNVIDDGELRLIDWEYAGVGDPYFDLASVCCYHTYSDKLRAHLLQAYLGADRRSALERLHRMCWLFDYIRELWFAVREMK